MSNKSGLFAFVAVVGLAATIGIAASQPFGTGQGRGMGAGMGQGAGRGMGQGAGMGMNNPNAPWRERLAAIDGNGDGVVSKAEMIENADGVFAAMDADGSGGLTPTEYMAVRMGTQNGLNVSRQAQRQADKQARFTPMDVNRDGVVDAAEFRLGAEQRFAAADADHDGRLSAAEFRRHAF